MNKLYITLIVLLSALLLLIACAPSIPRDILFWFIEGLGVLTLVFLLYFYRRVMRPIHVIGNGMELLREQDFSSRLRNVGEPEADRIVEVFNRMMTELKEGRLRLRERNHLLDLLVEVSPMGVVMLDFDDKVTSLNPAARQQLECTDDCIGKSFTGMGNPLAARIARLADGQSETFNMSDAHIYRCTRLSFLDRGFRHPFVLIESLTQDVMKAERDAYGKVIRMISHEANNTIAATNCIMETVGDELRELPGTQDMQEALQACTARSRDMSAFITRFADVVKIPDPQPQLTPLNSLVESNRRFLESLCSAQGIKLNIDLCHDNPVVGMDVALMAQVLVNIIKNSVESIVELRNATTDPSGHVDIDGRIKIETSASPAQITISDNGMGISPEAERNLFTPFFSTKPNGHGIGLLLIREILTKHKCRFSLRTGNDGITRFVVRF